MGQLKQLKNQILQKENQQKPILYDVFYRDDSIPKSVIIFSHGFKGFKDWGFFNYMAAFFARRNFVFVKFNFSHNGTTPQQPEDFADLTAFSENTYSQELSDLNSVIDFVQSPDFLAKCPDLNLKPRQLCLMGHSRGGSMSIIKAAEDNRVKALCTLSAVGDLLNRWPEEQLKEWKEKGVYTIANARTGQQMPMKYDIVEDMLSQRNRFDIYDLCKRINIPFLLIHGTEDEAVRYEEALHMKSLNKDIKLSLCPGAGHTLGGKHPMEGDQPPAILQDVLAQVLAFFREVDK